MLIKDVSNRILGAIEEPLLIHGFIFNKRKKEFKRQVNGVQQIFDLLFYKENSGSIFVEPQLRIKIKKIEDIYHDVTSKDAKYNDGTTTLGNNFIAIINYYEKGDEKGGKAANLKYLVENETDIDTLIKVILNRFEEYALPYFNSNSSVAEADKLLNENPRDLSVHNLIYPIRASIGIIAARLNDNPNFENLVAIYEEELEDANPINKQEFDKLKTMLRERNY